MKKQYRFTVDLSQADDGVLGRLSKRTGATTKAEAIRKAIRLYDVVSQKLSDGGEFLVRRRDGETELIVLLDQPASDKKK